MSTWFRLVACDQLCADVVARQVAAEVVAGPERCVTYLTLERPLVAVDEQVTVEVARLLERGAAHPAAVKPFLRVAEAVRLEVPPRPERRVADVTSERLPICMRAHVRREVVTALECGTAQSTLE